MKKRYVDGIYKKGAEKTFKKPEENREKPVKVITHHVVPTPPEPRPPSPKKRGFLWFILGGVFLVLSVLILTFWLGFLGPKMALARLFLGLNGKYLVLFQNNTELRPTGGFLGSFAEVEIKHGLIKKWDFETNIWTRDKNYASKICLPQPVPFIEKWGEGSCFGMRDSNWEIDFSSASQDIENFYIKEGGEQVDGVIALDATFFVKLLKIIGSIELPEYNLTLTPENFISETQYFVEKEYFKDGENRIENEPKTILKDMFPIVINRIKNPKIWWKLFAFSENELEQKNVLFYFNNPSSQKIAQRYDFTGEVKTAEKDYLYINNANLGGLKSSQNILEEVSLNIKAQMDGAYLNTLTIKRTHRGDGKWPDGINYNYTQVLIPKNSLLKEKTGIEQIDSSNEYDKTIFGFWTTVAPGETKTFTVSYVLPFKQAKDYSLLIQKQPGAPNSKFRFILENTQNLVWKYIADIDKDKFIKINYNSIDKELK